MLPHRTEPSHRDAPRLRGGTALVLLFGATFALACAGPVRISRFAARARVVADGGRFVETGGMVLQDSLSGCGPAALHNLLRALDVRSPGAVALGRLSGTGPRGSSLGRLARTARSLGVPLRARRIPDRELASVRPPFLAWLDGGHFVTVLAVDPEGRPVIHDPMVGGYRLPPSSFSRRWTGVVADLEYGDGVSDASEPDSGADPIPPFDGRSP